ncbi:MAG: flagellar export chaperone FliS, partial [Sulfolobales archaeon]
MVKPQNYYLEQEILRASPLDHVILLYSKAINLLKTVEQLIQERSSTPEVIKAKAEALSKAIDILTYLSTILDEEKGGEIARNLKEIYDILIRELLRFNFDHDRKIILDSIEILENLRKAWID